jgi:hypothetical protein
MPRKFLCLFFLIVLSFGFASAQVTQGSTSVGGGTLSWNASEDGGLCSPGNDYMVWDFSLFEFNYNGVIYELSGSAFWYQDNNGTGCPISGARPITLTLPSAVGYGNNCTVIFTPTSGSQGYANLGSSCNVGISGFINPKYMVVGVMYAPPGSSSFVEYTDTTTVGSTSTISSSFQNDVGFSVTIKGGVGIPATGIASGGVKLTYTQSSDYTQGTSSSTSTTVTQAASVSHKVGGTPTFSPLTNDDDYIVLWINPELLVTYTAPVGSTSASLVMTGYAFDPNDPASGAPPASGPYISGPDIIEVQVGCLNGHISCPSTLGWLNDVEGTGSYVNSGLLARAWQAPSNGYSWPAGEVAGLTFSDICQILSFDPLAETPSECPIQNDYTLLSSLPSTTSDGRYTKIGYPPNPINYPVGGATTPYTLTQTNSLSESEGNSTTIKQAFSLSEELEVSFLGIFSADTTLKESDTLTWSYSTLSALSTSSILMNALSVTGPPDTPAYSGPVEFLAYQDNTFGTFVFVPLN